MEITDYITLRFEGNSEYFWLEPQKQYVRFSYHPEGDYRFHITVYPLDDKDVVLKEVDTLINDGWRIDDAQGMFEFLSQGRDIII